jgi:hypothetical protein
VADPRRARPEEVEPILDLLAPHLLFHGLDAGGCLDVWLNSSLLRTLLDFVIRRDALPVYGPV